MGIAEVQAEARLAERHARRLAAPLVRAGKARHATEHDRTVGEFADLVVVNAREEASLFPRAEMEARLARMKAEMAAHQAAAENRILQRARAERLPPEEIARLYAEAAHACFDRSEAMKAEGDLWMAQHQRDAWRRAVAELKSMVDEAAGHEPSVH